MKTRTIFIVFGLVVCAGFALAVQCGFITFATSCPPGNCDEYYEEAARVYPIPESRLPESNTAQPAARAE